MKKLLPILPLLALLFNQCSNDFEVTGDWKEIPVVYGIISPTDTAHYIRVEKAFLDPEVSAKVIAKIADSLYYPENAIRVYLEQSNGNNRVQLIRVDGVQEGITRKEGIFATQPNWLYKVLSTDANLQLGQTYRLVIERADGREDITALTTIPADFVIRKPQAGTNLQRQLGFGPSTESTIEWRGDSNAVFFNVSLIIRYQERAANGQLLETKTLNWAAAKNVKRGIVFPSNPNFYTSEAGISGRSFYQYLHDNIPVDPERFRYFVESRIIVEGGGKEIELFQEAAAANAGITGAETLPTYTNMSEGYGLFTSKNSTVFGEIYFSKSTVDSMAIHPLTQQLNFRF